MKVDGIILGDLETEVECTAQSLSCTASVKFGDSLSDLLPKLIPSVKNPELRTGAKTSTLNPPRWSQASGENRCCSSVPITQTGDLNVPTHHPTLKIGKDACLVPFKVSHSYSSIVLPPSILSPGCMSLQGNDSFNKSPQWNDCCESKEKSCPVTASGGSSMVSGRACAKRKEDCAGDVGGNRKRPCFKDLGGPFMVMDCKPTQDNNLELGKKGQTGGQEVGVSRRSLSRSRSPVAHTSGGLERHFWSEKSTNSIQILPGPLSARGRLKGSQKDPDFSSRLVDMQATSDQSQSCRATQPERGVTSPVPCKDDVTSTLPITAGGTEQPRACVSPQVGLASEAGRDGANMSPAAGSCFPETLENVNAESCPFRKGPERRSGEDSDLSEPELDPEALMVGDSSSDSEDEPLLSLQEILSRSDRIPATPEKSAFPEPDTPARTLPPLANKSRPVNYKNTLEQILKETKENQRLKDTEKKLLFGKYDLLQLMEDSPNDGTGEEGILPEHRAILERYSVVSNGIPDVHPGEDVFSLPSFGRFFSQQNLDLRNCTVTPQNAAQKALLQASPDDLPFLICTGTLPRAYRSAPCQPAVTGWLFQMMSVHLDQKTSSQILQSMKDIALIAAEQIMNKSKKFEVWTPSIEDTVLILLNMGVPFTTLFPPDSLQPPFTEADILQSITCSEDMSSREQELGSFPEHCLENVMKYLGLCMALCPRAYSDCELQLLLTVVCRLSLDTGLRLLPKEDICCLLHHLLNNIRDWDSQLPRICQALTNLTENHHNLRWLVQLLPDHKRGKQLRKHLSVSIISKILNRRCTYMPVTSEFQLSALQQYLPRMKPSSLLSAFFSEKKTEDQKGRGNWTVSQDQQAYYLCYSLLTLANEATNFDSLPSNQKDQLQLLSAELEKHINVKDFVARIYTRWQVLLHKSRPVQGKLHDYWQPLPEDTLSSSQESQQAEAEELGQGCSSKSFKLYSPKEPQNGSACPPGTMLDRDVGPPPMYPPAYLEPGMGRPAPYGNQCDYRIFELNKRLQNWTEDCDNLWWDAFTTEFFEDDAMLTVTFCLEDGPKRYTIGRTLIPRYFRSIFEGGATELYYILKHPKETFHSNFVSLDCDQCTMVTQNGKPMFTQVCVEGRLYLELIILAMHAQDPPMLEQLSKNITRCGLSNSTLNYLRLCVILEPMQELMSRHKTYSLSPRDCLKTCLFQKWQRMVAPPAEPARQAPSKRRKRKVSGGSTISSGAPSSNSKKKSPAGNFTLSSQVPDVMVVGEPTLMGGEFGDEDERLITRLENTQFDAANGIDDEDSFTSSPALGGNSPWNSKAPSSQESKNDNPTSQSSHACPCQVTKRSS
ncbi:hypothetical protein GJAV_G00238330 [Gymnothorax javanicus]|nr:hypothetical protein GJAV_G00238330 [Gymnothorax javanicus]